MEENKVINQEVVEEVMDKVPNGTGLKGVAIGAAVGAGAILGGLLLKKAAKPIGGFIKDHNPFGKKVYYQDEQNKKVEEITEVVKEVVEETA